MISRIATAFFSLWLTTSLSGVEIRVACINVLNGVGAPGGPQFNALKETLQRVNPDVVGFAEVAANNTSPANAQFFADLRALVSQLGFPTSRTHLATNGDAFATQTFSAGDFGNSTQSIAVASRFPIARTVQIGRGATDRKEMTRFPLFVQIDVPGTANDPGFVMVHLKARESDGPTLADRFRKAVEAFRISQFLSAQGLHGSTHHIFVMGDFNEEMRDPQPASFSTSGITGNHIFTDGSTLPQTFDLGADVPATLPYAVFPNSAFSSVGLSVLPATQADGETDRTFNASGNARLDYILTGAKTTSAGQAFTEVYNSRLEHAFDGLPKATALPDPRLSESASDHYLIFADLALDPLPQLTVTGPVLPTWIYSGLSGFSESGSISLSQPSAGDLEVTISTFRPGVLGTVTLGIPSGQISAPFSLPIADVGVAPDRQVTVLGTASGHRRGVGTVFVRRAFAAGDLLFSQYTEPASGISPKAIEVINVSRREVDFKEEPLRVLRYTNGSITPDIEARIEAGKLPRGAVLVIGDNATGEYLVGQGLLPAPGQQFDSYTNGTAFLDATGRAVFVKDTFTFSGDDALELQLNFTRCDVFGVPGEDPGTGWGAPEGVFTADKNLSRRSTALAPVWSWNDPSEHFEVIASLPLNGFGIAPSLDDPYFNWTAASGLTGAAAEPNADPDGNGQPNLVEFTFGALGLRDVRGSFHPGFARIEAGYRLRSLSGNVRTGIQISTDMVTWKKAWEDTAMPLFGDGEEFFESVFVGGGGSDAVRFFRLYATKP
ncbi:MAG: endonuclease/exonuclease/phosphatase family protein [Verrucomicrobiales bacterium]